MKSRGKLISASLIAYTYIGTVVGAGFASGQEIMGFFTVYGRKSLWGIIIATFLFIFVGARILILGMELQASSFGVLIRKIFGFLSPVVNAYLLFAMMIINIAMLSGTGAMFKEFGTSLHYLGVIATALIAILTVTFGIKGILSMNKAIVIAILFFQAMALFATLLMGGPEPVETGAITVSSGHLVYKGITYASFNLMLSTGVLASLGYEFKDKSILKLGGLLGGGILGAMLLAIHYCLLTNMPSVFNYEIPMLYIISKLQTRWTSWFFTTLYAFVLWGGIFTTLIGNLFSMTSFFYEKYQLNHTISSTIIICLGLVLSPLGFSTIIGTLYPILGFIGMAFITGVIFSYGNAKT